jgi:heme/copper-type cytochrome/quinol oxidase subunit 1
MRAPGGFLVWGHHLFVAGLFTMHGIIMVFFFLVPL